MTDFPLRQQLPTHVHTLTRWGIGNELRLVGGSATPGAFTWTANQAAYIPVSIPWQYPVARVFWVNGSSATGNADFGIYTVSGKRIYSTGSTGQSGATTAQYVTPGTPFILDAGSYLFALAFSGTTSVAYGGLTPPSAIQLAGMGCLSQTSAFALPASATFATFAASGFVVCGITRTASGF